MGFSTLSPVPMTGLEIAKCDNCDWQGSIKHCDPIQDPSERLNAGSEVPAGECPECGCLAYVEQSKVEDLDRRRADFGAAVLVLLEATPEWNADTLDEIGRLSRDRGLSDLDDECMFRRVLA